MRRKGIDRLLWTALGIHIVYFVLLGIIVANQGRILEMWPHMVQDKPYIFSVPVLMSGASVLILAHMVLTALLVKRPRTGGDSMAGEWAGALIFGAGFPIFTLFGNWIAMTMVARLIGSYGLLSYSRLRLISGLAGPIRVIAVSLFLLAAGMSFYEKQSVRKGFFAKPKGQRELLWWSLGLDGAFFLIMMFLILFQNPIKTLCGTPKVLFVWPVFDILSYGTLLAAHLILTLCLTRQSKEGKGGIVCGILGVLLFSGLFEWAGMYLNWVSSILLARQGVDVMGNYGALTSMIGIFSPLHIIAIRLFIISCGLIIGGKTKSERSRI